MSTSNPWLERLLWIGLGALLSAAGVFLSTRATTEAIETAAASPPAGNGGEAPAPAALGREPECYLGVVLAREAVDVAAETEGHIEEIRVRVGDRLEHAGVIATLDTLTLRHQLEIERANLRNAEAQKRRHAIEVSQSAQEHQRRLALEGLLSKEEEEAARFRRETAEVMLEAAEAEVAQVEARIAQLESLLERARIRAPFAGTVAQRYLDPGARVVSGTPVVRLISSESLLTRFAVPPEETAQVPVGTPLRVEIEDLRVALRGEVEHVAPEVDAASEMVFVEARLIAAAPQPSPVPSGAVARVSVASPAETLSTCLDAMESRELGGGR